MELFGFSAAKIITILVIAIVIFGPDKVAEMARTVGRTIRDVRRYLNDMTKEFDEATGGLREEFTAITEDLRGELQAVQADLQSQLDLTQTFAETTTPPAELSANPAPTHPAAISAVPNSPPLASTVSELSPASVTVCQSTPAENENGPLVPLSTPDATISGPIAAPLPTRSRPIGRCVAGSAYLRRNAKTRNRCWAHCHHAASRVQLGSVPASDTLSR